MSRKVYCFALAVVIVLIWLSNDKWEFKIRPKYLTSLTCAMSWPLIVRHFSSNGRSLEEKQTCTVLLTSRVGSEFLNHTDTAFRWHCSCAVMVSIFFTAHKNKIHHLHTFGNQHRDRYLAGHLYAVKKDQTKYWSLRDCYFSCKMGWFFLLCFRYILNKWNVILSVLPSIISASGHYDSTSQRPF